LVIVDKIQSGQNLVSGTIEAGKRRHEISFRSALELSDHGAESLLLLALPAAMRRSEPLQIAAPVSPLLLKHLPEIQKIYHCWDPLLHEVEIIAHPHATTSSSPHPASTVGAIAFTGGVDSFYSAIRCPEAALMYVHGLDVPLTKHDLRGQVSKKLNQAATQMGRPLLEMETNLRDFSDRYLEWHLAFGGALAACALLLSRHINLFGIPAGQTYTALQPDGAHPVLNPLFGTENLAIHTTGCEALRVEKVAVIAQNTVAQGALRVCWENRGDAYNCGVCEKCLRTMAALEIYDSLQKFSTFEVPLDYERLSRAVASDSSLDMFVQENLTAARTEGAPRALIESLEQTLDRGNRWLPRQMAKMTPQILRDWHYRIFQR